MFGTGDGAGQSLRNDVQAARAGFSITRREAASTVIVVAKLRERERRVRGRLGGDPVAPDRAAQPVAELGVPRLVSDDFGAVRRTQDEPAEEVALGRFGRDPEDGVIRPERRVAFD